METNLDQQEQLEKKVIILGHFINSGHFEGCSDASDSDFIQEIKKMKESSSLHAEYNRLKKQLFEPS
ncbi:MAG: hypothetical protein V4561_10125 [Bacteroidota bacterium]